MFPPMFPNFPLISTLSLQNLNRNTALATAAIYQSMFGFEDGSVPATFQVSLPFSPLLLTDKLTFCALSFPEGDLHGWMEPS